MTKPDVRPLRLLRQGLLVLVASAGVLLAALSVARAVDDYDLLPEGEGRDEVFAICGGCHSIKLVIQQGLPRDRWDYLLDWMVEEQGMAEIDDETRVIVLDYLDQHLNTDHRPTYLKR